MLAFSAEFPKSKCSLIVLELPPAAPFTSNTGWFSKVNVNVHDMSVTNKCVFQEGVKSSLEYVWLGIILSFIMSLLPFVFRAHNADVSTFILLIKFEISTSTSISCLCVYNDVLW